MSIEKKDPLFKRLFFGISGYKSPTKALYQTVKDEINEVKNSSEDSYEVTPEEINIAKRNLGVTCYFLIGIMIYSLYKLVLSSSLIDVGFTLSVFAIALIVFLRNRYNLWILQTSEKITFNKWIQEIKKSPLELLP